jgi:hypothetical protein
MQSCSHALCNHTLHRATSDTQRPRDADDAFASRTQLTDLLFDPDDIFERPSTLPLALARASPAFTRSWIIARSNSAKTPHIWNSAFPAAVPVSMPC